MPDMVDKTDDTLDFATVALAHKLVARDTVERCQDILQDAIDSGAKMPKSKIFLSKKTF